MTAEPLWVVGSGGLLGRQVVARASRFGMEPMTSRVPWADPAAAVDVLGESFDRLLDAAGGGRWHVAWCAGSAVVASGADAVSAELQVFDQVLSAMADGPRDRGSFFLASSAGVYAGCGDPPYDEDTRPVPMSPYGELKLAMEEALDRLSAKTGLAALVGRLSNIYGPGQKLDKAQGLVSKLCGAVLTGEPATIHVPLETTRDYLYVTDAADMALGGLVGLDGHAACGQRLVLKVMSSGRTASIADMLALVAEVAGSPVPVAHEQRGAGQPVDLRLRSVRWPELDDYAVTPLLDGVRATYDALDLELRGNQA